MSFDGMSDKQLRERLRFLTDKIDTIWDEVSPRLNEFRECRNEFNDIMVELVDRGVIKDEQQTEPRKKTS